MFRNIHYIYLLGLGAFISAFWPCLLFKANLYSDVMPALEIIMIYCLIVNLHFNPLFLCPIYLLLDVSTGMPIGSNLIIILSANIVLYIMNRAIIDKNHITFSIYFGLIILGRYCFLLIINDVNIASKELYFYYANTVFSYPIMEVIIIYPILWLKNKYAR